MEGKHSIPAPLLPCFHGSISLPPAETSELLDQHHVFLADGQVEIERLAYDSILIVRMA